MVEPHRRRPSRGQAEDIEAKRHRMRVAQRKHRARKEQTIAELEDEVGALRSQLSDAGEVLRQLVDALHLADEDGDVWGDYDVDTALGSLRKTLRSNEASDGLATGQMPDAYANEAHAEPRSLQDPRQPGPFGALLYEYCIKLARRILSNSDKPSVRLGQRLFHAWLREMQEPLDDMAKLRYVRERLGMREARLGLVSDSRDREKTWRILKKPRLRGTIRIASGGEQELTAAGYEHYFDVAQLEVYLVRQGFVFSKDLTTVRLPRGAQRNPDAVPSEFNGEPMIVDHEPDGWMQNDMLFTNDWFENARNMIMHDFGAGPEFWDFGHLDKQASNLEEQCHSEALPFGFTEQHPDDPLPARALELDPALCGGLHGDGDSGDDDSSDSNSYGSDPTAASEISVAALLRRLAVVCVCVGEAGPGFAPEDVDKVTTDVNALE